MAKMTKAIKKQDWWEVQRLSDEYERNWSLQMLLDKEH